MSIKKTVGEIGAVLLLLVIGFVGGYFFSQWQYTSSAEIVEKGDIKQFDLKLPGEVEKRIVTKDEIEAKLVEIDQLATYSGRYTVSRSENYSRYLLDDILIPGTTNTISIECEGIVKVGYDVNDIIPTVDAESQKIYIALPEPAILDNYVIWDTVKCAAGNNILNPIDFEQYRTLIDEIEQEGLAQTEESGIYDAAEENARVVIQNFLACFEGYEIVFM